MIIKKKILPTYFEALLSGKKTFELRLNEFKCTEGDILLLEEYDADKQMYTGRTLEKKVSYISIVRIDNLFWPQEEILDKGLMIISLE